MLDPNLLRKQLPEVADRLAHRGFSLDIMTFESLEGQRRQCQQITQERQARRNQIAKLIGLMKSKGEDVSALMVESSKLNEAMVDDEKKLNALSSELELLMANIPNLPHESVPVGKNETENVEVRRWGAPRVFPFTARDHMDLGEMHHNIAGDLASQISGARFTVLQRGFARLHEALARLMLDTHVEHHGYEEFYVPLLVNASSLYGTGQLPKFEEDLFSLKDDPYYLIPTAEVSLTNLVRNAIIDPEQLPKKMVARTPCFRREAGSYGKDVRGLIRQHQFEKVEMVWATQPDQSYAALESMVGHAESILQALELPYRVIQLCTGDMGFGSSKTYDLEVWIPSQNTYREISSCSNCEAFQARRLMARTRNNQGKTEYLHTLNGSGVAVGRALVAVIENHQQEDGSIHIPKALHPYMLGNTVLKPH